MIHFSNILFICTPQKESYEKPETGMYCFYSVSLFFPSSFFLLLDLTVWWKSTKRLHRVYCNMSEKTVNRVWHRILKRALFTWLRSWALPYSDVNLLPICSGDMQQNIVNCKRLPYLCDLLAREYNVVRILSNSYVTPLKSKLKLNLTKVCDSSCCGKRDKGGFVQHSC